MLKLVDKQDVSGINTVDYNPVTKSFTDSIPQEWRTTLEAVQTHFPQAVIAGGALRDLWANKPVKDVDIFIPVGDAEENLYRDQLEDLDPYYETIVTNVYGQEGNKRLPGFRMLHAIYRLTGHSIPFELIFIQGESDDKSVSTAFDINICQIEYNGNWTTVSPAFLSGMENKQIEVVSINRADRQQHRIDRMLAKFPDFSVVVSPEFNVCSVEGMTDENPWG